MLKKIFAAVIAVTTAAVMGAVTVYAAAKGDVNNSGSVDIADVAMVMNHINGVRSLRSISAADVDGNGKVDIQDVAAIINQINGSKPIDESYSYGTILNYWPDTGKWANFTVTINKDGSRKILSMGLRTIDEDDMPIIRKYFDSIGGWPTKLGSYEYYFCKG